MKCRTVDLKTRKEEVNQGLDLDLLVSLVMSGAYVCYVKTKEERGL